MYAFTSASPGTARASSPSFSTVSLATTVPSGSVTAMETVEQALASPRYTQSTSHSTSWTHVDSAPTLAMRKKEVVGAAVGRALGDDEGLDDGAAEGLDDGRPEGGAVGVVVGAAEGSADGAAVGAGVGWPVGALDGADVCAELTGRSPV